MINTKPLVQFLRSVTPKVKIKNFSFLYLSFVWRRTRLYWLALFTSLILGILFFFIQPALTQEPTVLTMLMQGQDLLNWRPFVEEFEQKNPDIRINLVEGPFDSNLIENLYTSAFLLGDSPYDIINMDIVWVPKFAAAGWIMDLTNKISSEQLSKFVPGNVEGGRYNGKLYRIPHASDAGMLYYRKDILEQAGVEPPETFEQMVNISQNLQKQGKATWGYLWQGKQYEGVSAMFVEVLEGFGGFWANPQTFEIGLDKPEAIKAVEFLKSTIASGISPPGVTTYGEEETRILFQNGQTIFLRNWPYVWKLANVEGSKIKGKIAIKPMLHAAGKKGGSCLGGWGWGISKTSRHPEAAWRTIQYLTSEETQRKFILQTGFVPSYKSLFTDREVVALYPHYPQLLKVVEQSALRPPLAQYAQASDILQRYLSAAFTGRMSSEKAMKAAASETRNLLGSLKSS
ncbi:ABC transporter substrate-binding protein [Kamptonema animale CS-326]|jgi:multiple sugar transport system substrate-binding protein|uniref:ABC transporter substrate-binding protein n=1 Tax=Kamptonema animale TaxID=92934 RepID=UPI00232DE3A1|nr:ABC transporter substrate-binding protein [Kamptonema animale]MDB9511726.1 ABC transporter substrate-binding protein [Kamptonema animale CS-326]